MGHEKRTKVIAILALVVAVLGLSVGFSAYSKTLNIQNVQATVTGNQANFNVVLSTSSTSATNGSVKGNASATHVGDASTTGDATLNGTTISNLSATFTAGGRISYVSYAYNDGKIPAYLTGITFGGKTCTGVSGTSSELVSAACDDIIVTVQVGNNQYKSTNTKITDSVKLDPGKSEYVVVIIDNLNQHQVDGDFTATIPSITLTYSSKQNPTS